MAPSSPYAADCKKAVKLLEQYQRLARKYGLAMPAIRIQDLNDRRSEGTIKSTDLPAKLRAEFPGEFAGMSLVEIKNICGMK